MGFSCIAIRVSTLSCLLGFCVIAVLIFSGKGVFCFLPEGVLASRCLCESS